MTLDWMRRLRRRCSRGYKGGYVLVMCVCVCSWMDLVRGVDLGDLGLSIFVFVFWYCVCRLNDNNMFLDA